MGDSRNPGSKIREKQKPGNSRSLVVVWYNVTLVNVEDLTFHKCVLSELWREQGRCSALEEVLKPTLEDSKNGYFRSTLCSEKHPSG